MRSVDLLPVALLALLAATGPALAQPVPEGAQADAWCGVALSLLAEEVASTASREQHQMAEIFAAGGTALIEKATIAYGDAGWSGERTETLLLDLRASVAKSLSGEGEPPEMTFEDCAALAGFPD
jgi:hypothetical protein